MQKTRLLSDGTGLTLTECWLNDGMMQQSLGNRISAIIIFLLAGGLITLWSLKQFHLHWAIDQGALALEDDSGNLLLTAEDFPTASQERERGRFFRDAIFPPDFDEAEAAFISSIQKDPLSSKSWMELAELELQRGNHDEARVALNRSDELDPNFPRDRSEAIVLWLFLNDEEKAWSLAERLASLGGNNTANVAETLLRQGIGIEKIIDIIDLDNRSDSEVRLVLDRVAQYQSASIPVMWNQLSEDRRSNPDLRFRFAAVARNNGLVSFAANRWQDVQPDLETSDRLLIHEPDFVGSPFDAERFVFGWQRPDTSRFPLRWEIPVGDINCKSNGRLQWSLQSPLSPRVKVQTGRFIFLPGESESLNCLVSTDGFRRGQITIEVQQNNKFRIGEWIDISGECETLSIAVPESDSARAFALSLIIRNPVFDERRTDAVVNLERVWMEETKP